MTVNIGQMKVPIKCICVILVTMMLSGCATDPLTKTLKDLGYAPAIPAPATQYIGDIYEEANLKGPYLLMKEYYPRKELGAMMKSYSDPVAIPDSSGERKFKVSATADIIGKVNVELSKNRITSFKVKFKGAHQYLISKTKFYTEISPKIRKIIQNITDRDNNKLFDLNNKFAILALLQVESLEYEFYNDKDIKVSVRPGSQLEQVLKANIGADWSVNQKSNLSFSSPRFIGYRMGRLTGGGYTYRAVPMLAELKANSLEVGVQAAKTASKIRPANVAEPKKTGLKVEYAGEIQVEDIPLKDLRNAAAK